METFKKYLKHIKRKAINNNKNNNQTETIKVTSK
jgi:hypothetical protein